MNYQQTPNYQQSTKQMVYIASKFKSLNPTETSIFLMVLGSGGWKAALKKFPSLAPKGNFEGIDNPSLHQDPPLDLLSEIAINLHRNPRVISEFLYVLGSQGWGHALRKFPSLLPDSHAYRMHCFMPNNQHDPYVTLWLECQGPHKFCIVHGITICPIDGTSLREKRII